MKTPMTRSALRRAIPARLLPDIARWRTSQRISKKLHRAGFRRPHHTSLGIERDVIMNRWIVLKTEGWRDFSPPYSSRYRRSRTLAPTIRVVTGVIAQPRGKVMRDLQHSRTYIEVESRYDLAERIAERLHDIGDCHDGNFALFPDGTVRCIDY